jgi:hypothetical protein
MNAYLQRADDFIQQQIYKYEQKKQGRDYHEMQTPNRQSQPPSRAQTFNNLPAQGPPAPNGWTQEFDTQSQRWYYIERSTGRSQWEPPSFSQNKRGHQHIFSEHQRPAPNMSRDEEMARKLHEQERSRGRSSSHVSRPNSGHLGMSASNLPHLSPQGRLPPGAHLDMRTGQVVTNMFPPEEQGHWLNSK